MALKKATKEQAKLRLAIYGLSGGGKTYSSLAIATGLVQVMGGKVAVLDTEYHSASKYANIFEFLTDDFGQPSIENYIKFVEMVKEDSGVTVLVIDSLTHAWQYILETVDKLKETTCRGDSRKAWAIMTPEYKKLVNAILAAPFHVIGTMRAKTEWSTTNEGGNKTVRRDTLAPEQRDGFEYEFDMLMELNANHYGTIIKDRTNKFQDEIIQKPGIEFGRKLAEWLKDGAAPMEMQIKAVLAEIGNIVNSKSEKGTAYFTGQECESIRNLCKESMRQSQDARLEFLRNVLADQKKVLQDRVDQGSAPAAPPKSEAPPPAVAQQPEAAPPSPPKKPDPPKNEKPGLSEEFKRQIHEREQARRSQEAASIAPTDTTPAMFTEPEPDAPQKNDDDFEDDIPWEGDEEEAALASKELDIF
jgi:hypothetical protein